MVKLYFVETELVDCYVVAYDPTHAYKAVRELLDRQSYGFETERRLKKVSEVATSDEGWPGVTDNYVRLLVATKPAEGE